MGLTVSEIVRRRLINQQLSGTAFTTPHEIVQWFGAMQAQEYALTKWALGLRLPRLKDEDAERAFAEGSILRTHLLRPTWHFVAPEDIRWMLLLTAPHVQAGNAYMYRKMELDAPFFYRCHNILEKALAGGIHLTRPQIGDAFKQNNIIVDGLRLSLIMMQAELEGIVCSGPRSGNQFTYARLEERLPYSPVLQRDEALATLTNRHFTSRGPATIADFVTWSGLSVKDARLGIAMLHDQLVVEWMEGADYYTSAQIIPDGHSSEIVHLLPPYDEYIMGYKNRDAIMQLSKSINPPARLFFDNMIVFDGQIAGCWRRTVHKNHIDLEYHFLKPGRKLAKAFEKAAGRFEAFMGLPISLIEK